MGINRIGTPGRLGLFGLVGRRGALEEGGFEMQRVSCLPVLLALIPLLMCGSAHAIMAGGEFDLPADSPSSRIDSLLTNSPFNAVGSLSISDGAASYVGSATALSPNWALSAGHNADLDDDGDVDEGLSISLRLPGYGDYSVDTIHLHPDFSGFSNPTLHHDLTLLYFSDPLPSALNYPALGFSLRVGDTVVLSGYGRSGYGSYGYTTSASLGDRRVGWNVIDSLNEETGGTGVVFRYDFDDPATVGESGGSLGNTVETLIGPGDSGGPVLRTWGDSHALIGVNTFTEGYGGRFGDIGGGVGLNHEWAWVASVSGLEMIPEPMTGLLMAAALFFVIPLRRWRKRR
jgi:hypothetical protein